MTAQSAPTDPRQSTADSIASLKATRPGRPSMNASGTSRAACSERSAAAAERSTDSAQSALRHQRGWVNPELGVGGLPSPGSYKPFSGSGHGIRALSRNHTADLESLEFSGVAHKGRDFKVSRGSNLSVSGDNICHERGVPTGSLRYTQATSGTSGSGIAKPVSPIKHFMVLQAQTPEFRYARSHSGGDRVHSSHTETHTQMPRCERSLYRPEVGTDHPGQASGAGPSLNQPASSGTANAYPGVPAHPGTPITNPGKNLTGRFGPDHGPPRPNPPDQRAPNEEYDDAAAPRAPSLLAFPLPKAQNAARLAAVTPGPITASMTASTDATSSNFTPQSLHQTAPGLVTRLAKAVVSDIPFMRTTPCTTPPGEAASENCEETAREKGTTPSGIPVSEGRYPGQICNFGPGSTAASDAAREPTIGNVQHVPDPRANSAAKSLASAAQILHDGPVRQTSDDGRLDF